MPRTHGYSLEGRRCYGTHNWQARGRTNAIGALTGKLLVSVGLFGINVNGDVFHIWVIKDLLPKRPPDCVVVMDSEHRAVPGAWEDAQRRSTNSTTAKWPSKTQGTRSFTAPPIPPTPTQSNTNGHRPKPSGQKHNPQSIGSLANMQFESVYRRSAKTFRV